MVIKDLAMCDPTEGSAPQPGCKSSAEVQFVVNYDAPSNMEEPCVLCAVVFDAVVDMRIVMMMMIMMTTSNYCGVDD